MTTTVNTGAVLEARDLKKHFPVTKGVLISKTTGWIKAVDGISFSIQPGETLGIVCLLYTSPSPRDLSTSRMPSSA